MSIESRSRQYGRVFEHWQLREILGQGSGGKTAVFRLVHTGSRGVESALKVVSLTEEWGSLSSLSETARKDYVSAKNTLRDRAEQEVLMMNALRGRTNIVDYLDHTFVEWEEEGRFGCDMLIRMELLRDLRREIESRQVPLFREEEILKIGRDICAALVLCHGKRIIHRDIKPGNIFFNDDGNYKLGDFGISRILDAAPLSHASTGVGTPQYWAPEQITGNYDGRVDIYSLGLVLYELSNGCLLPFASSRYVTEKEILPRLRGTPLPPPRHASAALSEVILKACAFRPEDRYPTAQAFLDALEEVSGAKKAPTPIPERPRARFCGRCGSPVDEKTGRCPNCQPEKKDKKSFDLFFLLSAAAVIALAVGLLLTKGSPQPEPTEPAAVMQTQPTAAQPETPATVQTTVCGHDWQGATCENAALCTLCGVTDGDALGHDLREATFTAPMTCARCGMTTGEPLGKVGDVLEFGAYEQDGNTGNGPEPIQWEVLAMDSGKAFLLSRYGLDCRKYHSTRTAVTWEDSTLRQWLNGEFLNAAFSHTEREQIRLTAVHADGNPYYGTDPGNPTEDYIYLLSSLDLEVFFPYELQRLCIPTAYALNRGAYQNPSTGCCWWWLRTPGYSNLDASSVNSDGSIDHDDGTITSGKGVVRPAMWVELG